jgi:hypothetical protein
MKIIKKLQQLLSQSPTLISAPLPQAIVRHRPRQDSENYSKGKTQRVHVAEAYIFETIFLINRCITYMKIIKKLQQLLSQSPMLISAPLPQAEGRGKILKITLRVKLSAWM